MEHISHCSSSHSAQFQIGSGNLSTGGTLILGHIFNGTLTSEPGVSSPLPRPHPSPKPSLPSIPPLPSPPNTTSQVRNPNHGLHLRRQRLPDRRPRRPARPAQPARSRLHRRRRVPPAAGHGHPDAHSGAGAHYFGDGDGEDPVGGVSVW